MAVNNVNANEVASEIRTIFKDNKKKKDVLNKIAELGENVLNNLNSMDKTVYEIVEDYEVCYNEFQEAQEKLEQAETDYNDISGNIDGTNERIAELEEKMNNGELTADEKEELKNLYNMLNALNSDSQNSNKLLGTLQSTIYSNGNKLQTYNGQLDNIVSQMQDYSEAGTVIKDSANKYGKKNMKCERAMERNETSWWNFFNIKTDGKTQLDRYTNKAGLTEITNQTFYDDESHEFITEYEALEKKGKNQIGGKKRKGTAKVYSYGKTIESASKILKMKADAVKNEK
ncbi:MAG: hypothetical protein MJ230_02405 [bacterium]|nr:hypothetical protein [bacterium]